MYPEKKKRQGEKPYIYVLRTVCVPALLCLGCVTLCYVVLGHQCVRGCVWVMYKERRMVETPVTTDWLVQLVSYMDKRGALGVGVAGGALVRFCGRRLITVSSSRSMPLVASIC